MEIPYLCFHDPVMHKMVTNESKKFSEKDIFQKDQLVLKKYYPVSKTIYNLQRVGVLYNLQYNLIQPATLTPTLPGQSI